MRQTLFIPLLMAVFVSCTDVSNDAPPGDPNPSCSLLPGAVGNWWIYIDSTWRSGVLTVGEDTLRITGTAVIAERFVQIASGNYLFPSAFIPGCDTLFAPVLYLGRTWLFTPMYIRCLHMVDTFRVQSYEIKEFYTAELLFSAVEAPAGRFANCTRISDGIDETILFPGVGIIRRTSVADPGNPLAYQKTLTLKKTNVVHIGKQI